MMEVFCGNQYFTIVSILVEYVNFFRQANVFKLHVASSNLLVLDGIAVSIEKLCSVIVSFLQIDDVSQEVLNYLSQNDIDNVNKYLNTKLKHSTFLRGNRFSADDLVAYGIVSPGLKSGKDLIQYPHVIRWYNHVQHLEGVAKHIDINIEELETPKIAIQGVQKQGKSTEKKKETAAVAKPEETSSSPTVPDFSRLNIIVGKITRVWPHPEAERLWCEEIDCGEAEPRKIASGLREVYKQEEMENRLVCVLANLKPRALRGFESHGMVLCASQGDKVEFIEPPASSKPGDRVIVDGYLGTPDSVLNPKKNPWDTISPLMKTNDETIPVACFNGLPLKVGEGLVTCKSAKNTEIH
jgi:aminoacyl tRNA synthase complex-interacting multifunctional protein 1